MIAATSALQQQAGDIRQNKPNWQSYKQSQMISEEDYQCISALDSEKKAQYLQQNPSQCAKTFLSLLSHVSKDQTIQYVLVMIDDILQEDRSRVDIFHDYAAKRKESVWGPFLNLLNRQDGFVVNMSARILAKLACWGRELMPKSDLNFYLQLLKDQLTINVSFSETEILHLFPFMILAFRCLVLINCVVMHEVRFFGGRYSVQCNYCDQYGTQVVANWLY